MKSRNVKILAFLATLGGMTALAAPATAFPGLVRAPGGAPTIEKVGCGPYGCDGWGGGPGYYGPRPRPWGYGYGWRPRPWGWGHRPWGGGWGGGWGRGWGGGW